MMTWHEFATEAPELATAVRARFEAATHHVLATLRAGGAPRVSGTEVQYKDPDLWLGSMSGAVKARDLQRDGRFALHAHPGDPDGGSMLEHGDAKLSGVAVEEGEDAKRAAFQEGEVPHAFRLLLTEAVLTSVEDDQLVIRSWRAGAGTSEVRRT
ncbi:pyridoxamine 5'-phosphate oxidase family protein [Halostreptopolyspora alba]|uniref:Pyridoxamine 5'-phosphate oxidase family protein n=2 Tax=Halostreptopolyspora alba TaxID=2487137 RepID=A0A3N0EED9_9ACTN|nr:pyridoxamine 5'-phosphate oxidase family protein [Nocardiopsaceae bacterium YIM 96095]